MWYITKKSANFHAKKELPCSEQDKEYLFLFTFSVLSGFQKLKNALGLETNQNSYFAIIHLETLGKSLCAPKPQFPDQ